MLAIFGGTFDPIHKGHLQPVAQAAGQLRIEQVYLLPCHIPPHRQTPAVGAQQRLEMVRLACQDNSLFTADDRELRRNTPSYSFDTLSEFRQQFPDQSIAFFMGMDAFNHFDSWYRWQDILKLSHIIVCARPGYALTHNSVLDKLVGQQANQSVNALHDTGSGIIHFAEMELIDISATAIRQQLSAGQPPSDLLHPAVAEYIRQHGLYTHAT
ncbi:nicotinate-nucleotide adenylyltransferase [Neptunicella sp. SCSIO 80796]|uniref:nicotinate-nucleotide adenylyltransferase n=1 Tax=Neptunicella plasticusilytica TaxID=3117012 RepID=UPI003A4D98CF